MPAIKGNKAAISHVFALAGIVLATNRVISRMFISFERKLPRKIKPKECALLWSSLELLKLSSDQQLTWKVFLINLSGIWNMFFGPKAQRWDQ